MASFTLELDTTAPQAVIQSAVRVDGDLRVPYSVNEPRISAAWFESDDGSVVDGRIEPEYVVFSMGDARTGTVYFTAEDDVGNAVEYSMLHGRSWFVIDLEWADATPYEPITPPVRIVVSDVQYWDRARQQSRRFSDPNAGPS